MGILGKAIAKSATKAVFLHATDKIEKANSAEKTVENDSSLYKLIIEKKHGSFKRSFFVMDTQKNKKFFIKKEGKAFGNRAFDLFDLEGNQIAEVNRTKGFLSNIAEFRLINNGKTLTTMSQKRNLSFSFEKPFEGFSLTKKSIRKNIYELYDSEKNMVMEIKETSDLNDTYVVEYNNSEKELFGILLTMAIDLAIHTDD